MSAQHEAFLERAGITTQGGVIGETPGPLQVEPLPFPPAFRKPPGLPKAADPDEEPEPIYRLQPDAPLAVQGTDAETLTKIAIDIQERVRANPFIPIQPTPKQLAFLMLQQREALFGGAAGGGKSYCLLMGAAMWVDRAQSAALLLRKNYGDLTLPEALLDIAHQWWRGTAAHWHAGQMTWEFPSGATITFGHMQDANSRFRYQGAAFTYIGWDELTQFQELEYRYLLSRLRRPAGSDTPLYCRAASNPGGRGHAFVKERFVLSTDPAIVFLPALLDDNPYLDREEYMVMLEALDPVTRQQLLAGNWDAIPAGSMFRRDNFPIIKVMELPKIRHWVRYWDTAASEEPKPGEANTDPDYTVGMLLGQDYQDRVYICDVIRGRWSPQGVENVVMQTAAEDGRLTSIRMEQEGGSSGKTVIEYFARRMRGYDFQGMPSTGSKEVRAGPVATMSGRGDVFLVDTGPRFQEWYMNLMLELEAFVTPGVHDDQVDALSGGVNSMSFRTDVGADLAYRNQMLARTVPLRMPTGRGFDIFPV